MQLKETKSASKKFAIQYRIDGKDWIDPDLFLVNAKQSITNLLINRQQTQVKLILSCMMEKVDLKSGEVIAKEATFHSKQKSNYKVLTLTHCLENERNWSLSQNFKAKEVIGDSFSFESGSSHRKV